jgi:hypothetical protein
MTTPKENPEATRISQNWARALERLSEEDRQLLNVLRVMGQVVDPRYGTKGIGLLVSRALVDPAFRSQILKNADAALTELRLGHVDLPENVHVRCVENSTDYLTIVLPPPSDALSERPRSIRDFIVSRTSAEVATLRAGGVVLEADGDFLPTGFDHGTGDPDFQFGD